MKQKTLETLIGKYLDGQITPSEQHLLETALEEDSQAKEFFEQLQDLHQRTRQTVASNILECGKAPDDIFEQAWRQTEHSSHRIIKTGVYLKFAAVAAAVIMMSVIGFWLERGITSKVYGMNDVPVVLRKARTIHIRMWFNLREPSGPRLWLEPEARGRVDGLPDHACRGRHPEGRHRRRPGGPPRRLAGEHQADDVRRARPRRLAERQGARPHGRR